MPHLTAQQFGEWQEYARLEPFGYWDRWARFAMLAAVIANGVSGLSKVWGGKTQKRYSMEDFMPKEEAQKSAAAKRQPWKHIRNMMLTHFGLMDKAKERGLIDDGH
uniref:Minor tail T domain-containing protein n=1 Tax=viral metagenome TaxID=1070528 RepID=A0A6M3IPU1_9ZZZZ